MKSPEENELKAGQDLSSADLLSADVRLRLEVLKLSRDLQHAESLYRWVKGEDLLVSVLKSAQLGKNGNCRKKIESTLSEFGIEDGWISDLLLG
jgi:hypothetical protein